jgi:hypothetical protein
MVNVLFLLKNSFALILLQTKIERLLDYVIIISFEEFQKKKLICCSITCRDNLVRKDSC